MKTGSIIKYKFTLSFIQSNNQLIRNNIEINKVEYSNLISFILYLFDSVQEKLINIFVRIGFLKYIYLCLIINLSFTLLVESLFSFTCVWNTLSPRR